MDVRLEHIVKTFDARPILDDLTLSVESGTRFVVMGRSGSGKTTLLRLIAGLDKPDKGTIMLGDRYMAGNGRYIEPHQRSVGFIFQELALWPHLTVRQNCDIILRGRVKETNVRKEKIHNLLEQLEIKEFAESFPHSLSAGEKQRVALARALITQPGILLLDEPLNYLDVHLKRNIMNLIINLQEQSGITMIYVTHLPDEAILFGGNAGVLDKGVIDKTGPVDEIVKVFTQNESTE